MQYVRTLVLALIAAAPLAAQQPMQMGRDSMRQGMGMGPHHPQGMMGRGMMGQKMMGHGMGMGVMMGMMAFTPGHLLGHQETLDLTPQQVTRLTALRDEAKTAHDAAMTEARKHHEQLAQVMKAKAPDVAAARTHFEAAHAALGKAQWAEISAAAQARALLTDVQRARVDGWVDAMRMGHGGAPHGQMRGHDMPGPHHSQ